MSVHLAKHECYDEDSAWCAEFGLDGPISRDLAEATCTECLTAAMSYGIDCAIRRAQIRDGLEPRNLSRADIEAFLDGKMKP